MPPVLLIAAISFVGGVLLRETQLSTPVAALAAGSIPAGVLLTPNRYWRTAVLVAAVALLGGMARNVGADLPSNIPASLRDTDQFEIIVLDVPRHYPSASFSRAAVVEPEPVEVVWAVLPPAPYVQQGDTLLASGSFTSLSPTDSATRGFAAQRGTAGRLDARNVTITGSEATSPQRLRNDVSSEIRRRIRENVPEPAGAFSLGVLLGNDGAMTEATRDAFRVGGLTHLTAVSGLHTGLVAAFFLLVSRFGIIHRWYLLVLTVGGVWMFAYLVGMRPSVTRASFMLTVFVIAQLFGRPRDTLNALLLATAGMIFIDPTIRYDVGFQLSVAATLGIALALILIQGRSPWHALWVVPLAAELSVEPLILYHFGYYSLVSPFANILAAPFVAAAMLTSVLTVLASLLDSGLGTAFGIAAWFPSRAVVFIADTAAQVPLLSGEIEPLSWAGVWIAYSVLGGVFSTLYLLFRPVSGEQDGDIAVVYRV